MKKILLFIRYLFLFEAMAKPLEQYILLAWKKYKCGKLSKQAMYSKKGIKAGKTRRGVIAMPLSRHRPMTAIKISILKSLNGR